MPVILLRLQFSALGVQVMAPRGIILQGLHHLIDLVWGMIAREPMPFRGMVSVVAKTSNGLI